MHSSHVETDQAQQLDHANCQAENSKLLRPQWRKHERRKYCDGRVERWVEYLSVISLCYFCLITCFALFTESHDIRFTDDMVCTASDVVGQVCVIFV